MGGVSVDLYILDMVWTAACAVAIRWARAMNIYHHCIVTVLFLAVVGDIGSVLNTLWSSGFELASSSSGFLLPVAESVQSGVLHKIQQNKGKKNNTILKHKFQGKNGTNGIRWGKKNKGDKKHWTVDDKGKVVKPKWWKKEHKWWKKEHIKGHGKAGARGNRRFGQKGGNGRWGGGSRNRTNSTSSRGRGWRQGWSKHWKLDG